MRVLHVVPTYIPAYRYGGPIKSVHGLCRGLVELGHDVHVFTTNVDGADDSDVPLGTPVDIDGVKVWYFPSKRLRRLYWSPRMARALQEQIRSFDVLHLHSIFLWPTWSAARAARHGRIPYLISPRGMLVKDLINRKSRWIKTAWLALIERHNLERASCIHVTSRLEADEALEFGYRLPTMVTIPNGVDVSDCEARHAYHDMVASASGYVLFLGRVSWKKGLDRLVPALVHLPESIRLVIAGNDDEQFQPVLEALADKCGVRDRIVFAGLIRGVEKTALLQHAALLVLPSYSENFGNVVLEAMAVGCPVAVTPEVGAADIVREYRAGMVIDGDPATLGAGLRSMLEDRCELEKMGQRGREAVKERFSWPAIARQMEIVYKGISK